MKYETKLSDIRAQCEFLWSVASARQWSWWRGGNDGQYDFRIETWGDKNTKYIKGRIRSICPDASIWVPAGDPEGTTVFTASIVCPWPLLDGVGTESIVNKRSVDGVADDCGNDELFGTRSS